MYQFYRKLSDLTRAKCANHRFFVCKLQRFVRKTLKKYVERRIYVLRPRRHSRGACASSMQVPHPTPRPLVKASSFHCVFSPLKHIFLRLRGVEHTANAAELLAPRQKNNGHRKCGIHYFVITLQKRSGRLQRSNSAINWNLSVNPFFSRYSKNLCDFILIILILTHLFASISNCSFI